MQETRYMDGPIPDPEVRPVLPVATAGAFLGLSRAAAYRAVERGEIPVIRLGGRLVVPTAALRRLVGLDREGDQR